METKRYKICRNQVYVGAVVKAYDIYRHQGDSVFGIKNGQLNVGGWKSYRTMLFVPDENGFSNDLLFRTKPYPVLNVTDDKVCLQLPKESIVVKDSCNLEELLKYFHYDKTLTYEDIVKIRNIFFNGRFAKDHAELFGWHEHQPEDWTYYENGIEVTDPKRLKRIIQKQKKMQEMGHRSFWKCEEGILSNEYWEKLNRLGDHAILDVLNGFENRMNAFKPHKEEGPVKKLSLF